MRKTPIVEKQLLLPFVLITSLFFMWGLANNMTDTLLAAFKRIMSMTDFQTSWIQMSFYGAYFCLALPAAILIKKFNYKTGVLWGLGLFIAGALLFYPASNTMVYGHFLSALFILAGGLSILETSANPYILSMGNPETATQRLNLAQSFNPIGSIFGVLLSKVFILSQLNQADANQRLQMSPDELQHIQQSELMAVMGPYVGIAVALLLIWLAILSLKMPEASDQGNQLALRPALGRLLRNKTYTLGVLAQFFYVGAQIGVWSYTIRYVMLEKEVNESSASTYYLTALILFTFFRFVFTWLMKFFKPGTLLLSAALGAMISSLAVIYLPGTIAVAALIAISVFMSLMFPTIYGLAAGNLGEDTKIGGSGLIMAILGGAVLTAVQGQVSDFSGSIRLAYWVPLLCFAYIAWYANWVRKIK